MVTERRSERGLYLGRWRTTDGVVLHWDGHVWYTDDWDTLVDLGMLDGYCGA